MPHYKDFSGFFAELPSGSEQFWGAVYTEADLAQASTSIEWTTHQANSSPALVVALPDQSFWQSNQAARPETLAVMLDPAFSTLVQTQYKVWDIDWNQLGMGVPSPRAESVSLQQLISAASNAQPPPQGIQHSYFQVNSLPPLAVPAMSPSVSVVLALCLIGTALFASIRNKRSKSLPAR